MFFWWFWTCGRVIQLVFLQVTCSRRNSHMSEHTRTWTWTSFLNTCILEGMYVQCQYGQYLEVGRRSLLFLMVISEERAHSWRTINGNCACFFYFAFLRCCQNFWKMTISKWEKLMEIISQNTHTHVICRNVCVCVHSFDQHMSECSFLGPYLGRIKSYGIFICTYVCVNRIQYNVWKRRYWGSWSCN